jgi:hypothetical protein
MTGTLDWEEKAEGIGRAFSQNVKQLPSAHTQLMVALDFGIGPCYEVVIAGSAHAEDTKVMVRALRTRFLPNKVVLLNPAEQNLPETSQLAAVTRHRSSIEGKATAYVCLNYSCKLPTTDVRKMLELLGLD